MTGKKGDSTRIKNYYLSDKNARKRLEQMKNNNNDKISKRIYIIFVKKEAQKSNEFLI